MSHSSARAIAGALAAGLLLAGCSSDPDPAPTTGPGTSASVSPSTEPSTSSSPSPTSTLTAEEQQAFEEATAVVLRYEQMFYDILSDPEPRLNDMNGVATQPQISVDLRNLQEIVSEGGFVIESGGSSVVRSAIPIRVALDAKPATVVLEACVDQTSANGTQNGQRWTGPREIARYNVVKTTYLPAPGWAVARVLPPAGSDQPQPC